MPLFRKKPVIVTAERLTRPMVIETLEGNMQASPGDWLIKGVRGEYYPCKDDIFRQTHEPVDNESVRALVEQGSCDAEYPPTIPFPGVTTTEIA